MTKLRRTDFVGLYMDDAKTAFMYHGELLKRFFTGTVMFDLQSDDGFFKTERVPLTQEENVAISRIINAARDRMRENYDH